MSTPVLRHETGESLAAGRVRVQGALETNRAYAFAPTGSSAEGIVQGSSAFSSSQLQLMGGIGVYGGFEAQLRTNFAIGGSGWRLSGKYGAWKSGSLAVAAIIGYGRASGSGTRNLIGSSDEDVPTKQTLAAKQLDLGPAVSYRFGTSQLYGGVTYFKTSVEGTAETTAVEGSFADLGANIGYRMSFGSFDVDIELGMLKVEDSVGGGSTMGLHYGIGGGLNF